MLIRPVNAKFKITSGFGPRIHPTTKKKHFHDGVDFGCPVGTPIVSCFDGIVQAVKTKDDGNGAGNRVWVTSTHERGGYFHMDDDGFEVKGGQAVKAGQILGFSGETGRVSGPHLHFTWRDLKTDSPIEPIFEETV